MTDMTNMPENFELINADISYNSRPIGEILKDAKGIDPTAIAKQILNWLIVNVENYIDNHETMFKMDLVLDDGGDEGMEEVKKLQDLYRAIPDSERDDHTASTNCRLELDKITARAYDVIQTLDKDTKKLFDRLIFYYEMRGLKNGVPIIQEMEGVVSVVKFEYEAFSVGVQIKAVEKGEEDGEKKVIKEYTIPEGFTVWIELTYHPKSRPQSIF